MEKIYSRQYSGIEQALRMVVRTQDDWRTIWSRIVRNQMPQPEPPEIDFSKSALIVAAMGQRRSGGYSIDVTGAEFREGRLEATVLETSPGRGCIVTQALTSPVVVVRIPAGIQPVSFIEEKRTTSCR